MKVSSSLFPPELVLICRGESLVVKHLDLRDRKHEAGAVGRQVLYTCPVLGIRALQRLVQTLDVVQAEALSVELLAALVIDILKRTVCRSCSAGSLKGVQDALGVAAGLSLALGLDEVSLSYTWLNLLVSQPSSA